MELMFHRKLGSLNWNYSTTSNWIFFQRNKFISRLSSKILKFSWYVNILYWIFFNYGLVYVAVYPVAAKNNLKIIESIMKKIKIK